MRWFLVLLLLVSIANADKCGSNCPQNKCPSCPCGTQTNMVNPVTYCAKFKDWNQKCCQCIVRAESGGNANAANYNGASLGFDVGLWQINQYWNWGTCNGGKSPCDPDENLKCAKQVWLAGGKSFKQWATAKGCGC